MTCVYHGLLPCDRAPEDECQDGSQQVMFPMQPLHA
jgi:hypothetical protein